MERNPGESGSGGGAEGEDIEWADGDKRFGDESGRESSISRGGARLHREIYMSEESKEGVTVIRQGGSSKSESCQEL